VVKFKRGEAETSVLGPAERDPPALDEATYGVGGHDEMCCGAIDVKPPLCVHRACTDEFRNAARNPLDVFISYVDLDDHVGFGEQLRSIGGIR
jgi:hypothetical protein